MNERQKKLKKLYKGLKNTNFDELPEIDFINYSHLKGFKKGFEPQIEENWLEYRYL